MTPSNPNCINAGKLGYECVALMKPVKGCLEGKCPFYKTQEDFEKTEKKAKDKCYALGIHFRSRDEVIDEMNGTTRRDLKKLERERQKLKTSKVIQYNSRANVYIEYENSEKCAEALGIPVEIVESIIKRGEVYKGFKFVIG